MVYTDEILEKLVKNIELFEPIYRVLAELGSQENELSMKELAMKLNITAYPFDKAILALEFSGLVERRVIKNKKIYEITPEGRSVLKLLEVKNG